MVARGLVSCHERNGACCAGAALAAGAGAVRSPDGPASLADGVAVRARPG